LTKANESETFWSR